LGVSIPIVNWTFYLSFLQPAISSAHAATLTWTEAKQSKELRLDVSSVDRVLKVR